MQQIEDVFLEIAQEEGGAETVVHLAAHYDFTGDETPEYHRTNVRGLRNVLDLSARIGVRNFVFSSSVAACTLPTRPDQFLTEASPPDGRHIYARTKRAGEEMLAEYQGRLKPVIVRFAALFSDWCEYPPLYMFLRTWLSNAWNRRILGGRGQSAIPYMHVHDVVLFLVRVLDRLEDLNPREVLIASPDGCTSHEDLFEAATLAFRRVAARPVHMPKAAVRPGHVRDGPAGAADRRTAVRAAVDGRVHRHGDAHRRAAARGSGSAGRPGHGWRSSAGCRSSSRTSGPMRRSGTRETARP